MMRSSDQNDQQLADQAIGTIDNNLLLLHHQVATKESVFELPT
jgi:hypothetical protein